MDINNKKFKRATTNHITWADYDYYESFDEFVSKNKGAFFFMTRYGKKPHSSIDFAGVPNDEDIYLIFGKESTGIPLDILKSDLKHCLRIPMTDKVRALNLSNCAAIMVYEVLRQRNYDGLLFTEPFKGENYIETGIDISKE